jgi:hypothetical protein
VPAARLTIKKLCASVVKKVFNLLCKKNGAAQKETATFFLFKNMQ